MKKLTKIMTAAGCALLIGGGLSLFAAAVTSAPQTRAASEGGPVILYGAGSTVAALYNNETGDLSSSYGEVYFTWDFNPETMTTAEFKAGSGTMELRNDNNPDNVISTWLLGWNISVGTFRGAYGMQGGNYLYMSSLYNLDNGSYTLTIPAGFIEFANGEPNDLIEFKFTIDKPVIVYINQIYNEYASPEALQNGGVKFYYNNVLDAGLQPVDPEQAYQVTVNPPDGEPIGPTTYGSSCLNITEGEYNERPAILLEIKLPAADVNKIPEGSYVQISIPEGWYQGVSETAGRCTNYQTSTSFTLWAGMTERAQATEQYNYVSTVPEIEITWAGQKVTLTEKYAATNTVPVTINWSQEPYNVACEITSDGNLKLTGLPAAIDEFLKEEPGTDRFSIGIPAGIVENEKGQVNLAAEWLCEFTVLPENAEFNPTITSDPETGVVTIAWTQDNIDYIQFIGSPLAKVMNGENEEMTLYDWQLDKVADANAYTFNIASLLPNQEYTVVIDAYAIKVKTTDNKNYANTKVTSPVKYNVTITESGKLGEGVLSGLYLYNPNFPGLYQGTNSFTLSWQEDGVKVPVGLFDPSKITGYVRDSWDESGWLEIDGIQVNYNQYSYDIRVNLPPDYSRVYNEFKFEVEEGLVYAKSDEGVLSNAAQTVTYSTYGQFGESNVTSVPAQVSGQTITPDQLKTLEVEFALNDDQTVENYKLGTGSIFIRNARNYQTIYTVQESDITLNDNKLIFDLSEVEWQNDPIDIVFEMNALQVVTNWDYNWFNSYFYFNFNVWAGMSDATVTGPDGQLSLGTIESASFDGIYTIDWGEKVTPTENFQLTYSREEPVITEDSEGNEIINYRQVTSNVDEEYISFLTADGQLATFEEGGVKMVLNATKLIQESVTDEYRYYVFFTIVKGSVRGEEETAINPQQMISYITLAELSETTAEISGPADGIITIAWDENLYRIANYNGQRIEKGIELYDSENNLIDTYTFDAETNGSMTPQPEGYPLQFLINEARKWPYGFTLNLNEIGLPYGSNEYKVVLPEGCVQIVTIDDATTSGYKAPINAKQEYGFSFESYGLYEGDVEITPLPGGTVEELYDVTITFVDAQEINLVGKVYVNDQPLTASDFNIVNNSLTIINPLVDEEEITIFIEAGAIVIDGKFINEEIKESYTISSESDAIAGIEAVDGRYEVYTIAGVHVLSTEKASALNTLANGLYIINGKKVYIRK